MTEAKITLDKANKSFMGPVYIGEYVAWWISDDNQERIPMTWCSYKTDQEAIDAAMREVYEYIGLLEMGYIASALVVDDAE